MVAVATQFRSEPLEFPSIIKQAKRIAFAYKFVGLYSTVMLTLVTVVSMTNVFTSGTFAQWSFIPSAWAFIFAATIDLNIVRMFVDAAIERTQKTRGAWIPFCIGLGLSIVTCAALFIEGLQQSIGLNWHDATIQKVIAVLIGCRVVFVIVLMAREGTKLGVLLASVLSAPEAIRTPIEQSAQNTSTQQENTQQNNVAEQVEQPQKTPVASVLEQQKNTDKLPVTPSHQQKKNTAKPVQRTAKDERSQQDIEQEARTILNAEPTMSVRNLGKRLGVQHTRIYSFWKQHRSELAQVA